MVGMHFDGTVALMEHKCVLDCNFLARRCLSSSPEVKSAPCLFLASWSTVHDSFWVDLAGINKMFETSGKPYVLGYASWELSLHYPEPFCKGAHRSMPHGQVRFGTGLLPIGTVWMAFGGALSLGCFWGRPGPVSAVIRLSFLQKLQPCWSAHLDESISTVLST